MTMDVHRKFLIYKIIHMAHVRKQIPSFEGLDAFKAMLMAQECGKNNMFFKYDREAFINSQYHITHVYV